MLQIETRASGIGGEKYAAGGVVTKPLDQSRPLFRRHPAVKADISHPARVETADDDIVGPRPLRKHHGLGLGIDKQFIQQCRQFVGFDAMIGFLVEQIRAVARHPHVLQGDHQPSLIRVRQKPGLTPAPDDLGHFIGVCLVIVELRLGHRHQQVLV
jgi:hypothetical protein